MTKLFMSDVHGEYESFSHVLRNGCGLIRKAIDEEFDGELDEAQRAELATLIYYPERKLAFEQEKKAGFADWCKKLVGQLVDVLACFDEQASARAELDAGASGSREWVISLAQQIQHAAIDEVYVLGDVYDRGTGPDLIMDELAELPNMSIIWGNHDIVWMGAALGHYGCIAHVVRNCARYGNLAVLSDSYGIDMAPLARLAYEGYGDDPCVGFALKGGPEAYPELTADEYELNVKIQKITAILQFKVEAQLIADNPSFGLEDRNLLHTIDFETNTVVIDGIEYPITDTVFPTVDKSDPYRLTPAEEEALESLSLAFLECERLQRHMKLLIDKGSLYRIVDGKLLFHACVPLNEDASLLQVTLYGKTFSGKALFDEVDRLVRSAFVAKDEAERKRGQDMLWYLWLGKGSPLFAKSKMATFEIYYVADKSARVEVKNPFYSLLEDERLYQTVFKDFGMDVENSRFVCGHVPVKVSKGEDPVKCSGKGLFIDGGLSKPYQKLTGIAGFAMLDEGEKTTLYALEPFCGTREAIEGNKEIGMSSSRRI